MDYFRQGDIGRVSMTDADWELSSLTDRGRRTFSESYRSRNPRSESPTDHQGFLRSRTPLTNYQRFDSDIGDVDAEGSTISCNSHDHFGVFYKKPILDIKTHEKAEKAQEGFLEPSPRTNLSTSQSRLFEPTDDPFIALTPQPASNILTECDYFFNGQTRSPGRPLTPLFEPTDDPFKVPTPQPAPNVLTDYDYFFNSQARSHSLSQSLPETMPEPAMKRSRSLKANLEARSQLPILSRKKAKKNSVNNRVKVEDDPENILIKDLRTKHNLGWSAIADYLNEKRGERGEPQTLTHAAVYSRFVRNAPRVAMANGETGFDPKKYLGSRYKQSEPTDALFNTHHNYAGGDSAFLSQYPSENQENEIPLEDGGGIEYKAKRAADSRELESGEKTEKLMNAVAVVESNFWGNVAGEMERTTGKSYDPKALESRWNAV